MHKSLPVLLLLAGLGPADPALARTQGTTGTVPGAAPRAPRSHLRRTPLGRLPLLATQCGLGPLELDQSVGGALTGDGGPLTVNGQIFEHGFGTASTSLITVDLAGVATRFASWVGVDDEVASSGSVVFRVVADDVVIFDSGPRTGTDPAVFTGPLDVTGARELQLLVLDAGDGRAGDHADWGEPTVTSPIELRPGGQGALSRRVRGAWEPELSWPVKAIHATLLPSGRILSHASAQATSAGTDAPADPHDSTRVDLADIATWSHASVDHPAEELYGAGHARSSTGSLVVLGGHAGRDGAGLPFGRAQASRFDEATASWIPVADLSQARWGTAALTLGNGDVLALAGAHAGGNAHVPEAFGGDGWRTLRDVDTLPWWNNGFPELDHVYPFAHLASDGRVFVSGWDEDMAFFDVRGNGTWSGISQRESRQRLWGSAVQFDNDRALLLGGVDGTSGEALRSSVVVDFSGPNPVATPGRAMLFRRADAQATLLADGSVFVHGGGAQHANGASSSHVRVPEIWNPVSGTWRVAAEAAHPRGFRSTSLLLPDGRVWTAGGECGSACSSGATAEVFRPPYLYSALSLGQLAARPVIADAPASIEYDASFDVTLEGSPTIGRVTLLRGGSATHGLDFDQRFRELTFVQNGSTLSIDAPTNGNLAPPGHYMLFAFGGSVPSVAATVRLGPPSPGTWQLLNASDASTPENRHEAAMVALGGKLYLIGGRGARPVQEYDPVLARWTDRGDAPIQMHHFQPVVFEGLAYVVGAFVGNYPDETPVANIYLYDPADDSWTLGPAMPASRNRGSAGTVVHEGKFYLVGGNTLGHNGGAVPWFDVFDPATLTWTALPDAPHARDHFLAAVVGNKLVAAGGRTTDLPNPFDKTVPEVDVFDFSTGAWTVATNDIPTERAGTMTVPVGQFVVVAGGESDAMTEAHSEVEAFDVLTGEWLALPGLAEDRHSGGVAVHDGRVWVASGAGRRGGSPELDSFEVLGAGELLAGASSNRITNSGFDAGLAGWRGGGDLGLSGAGGVQSPALTLRGGEAVQTLAGSAATTYTLAALYRSSAGAGSAELALVYLDASGAVLGSDTTALPATSAWTSASVSGTSPAGTAAVRVTFLATQSREIFVDDVVLRP